MVELFQSNDSDIIDLLMRSFHKDYTLHFNVYTHFISPTLRWRRVFLCDEEMWCHSLWLSVSGATQQIMLMCFVVVVVVCIVMLHRVIIICNNCPICNAGARARLAAKWYWPIAPNSTRLTRTHHLTRDIDYKTFSCLIQNWNIWEHFELNP